MPFAGERCGECELHYHESRGALHMKLWFLIGCALPWLALAAYHGSLPSWSARSGGFRAITTGYPMLDILIMVAFTSWFAGKAAMGLRLALHRHKFLR